VFWSLLALTLGSDLHRQPCHPPHHPPLHRHPSLSTRQRCGVRSAIRTRTEALDTVEATSIENLIKTKESNGETVSWYRVDDYFYYAKGVASALETILEAVMEDFQPTLENRHATEILHHAIASCKRATEIDPWLFVTDSDYSGILANHRANMAAPISHARFYIEVLIAVLST